MVGWMVGSLSMIPELARMSQYEPSGVRGPVSECTEDEDTSIPGQELTVGKATTTHTSYSSTY
jgi:hypothetical protein